MIIYRIQPWTWGQANRFHRTHPSRVTRPQVMHRHNFHLQLQFGRLKPLRRLCAARSDKPTRSPTRTHESRPQARTGVYPRGGPMRCVAVRTWADQGDEAFWHHPAHARGYGRPPGSMAAHALQRLGTLAFLPF